MTVSHQPPDDARAHPSKPDHSQLERRLSGHASSVVGLLEHMSV
jgi:hypothetical protein